MPAAIRAVVRSWPALAGLGLAGLLAASIVGEAGARQAVTRAQANAIAIRLLRPQADKGDVVLFGLPTPLAKGSFVVPADPPKGRPGTHARVPIRRLSGPAWLFWLDREPGAFFSHPSEYLLLDAGSGRVLTRARLGWYPAIDGRQPPFVSTREGYTAKRYRVFARIRRTTSSASSPSADPGQSAVPPDAFKDDCVLMIGDYTGWHFENDYPALAKWGSSVHLRTFFATPKGPAQTSPGNAPTDDEHLTANVKELVDKQDCKDVLVYLAGHGSRDTEVPFVATGDTVITGSADAADTITHGITPAAIEKTLRDFPSTTFKLKISSCYSGRFLNALTEKGKSRFENLLIIEVSSPSDTFSYGAPVATKKNPDKLTWFMNQNLTGLRSWASSESEVASSVLLGGSLLARALERAFTLGRSANASIQEHVATPLMVTNFTEVSYSELPRPILKTFALSADFKQPWQVAWVGNGTKNGALVFTDRGGNQVGAMDPATGKTDRFPLQVITAPNPIAVIDDNRFAVGGTGGVAIFDRRGSGAKRELQLADTQVSTMSVGPDGKLWYTNILNGQVVSIKDPYSGPADITKLGPYPGCRPTGVVPGVTDVFVLCQQSNDLRVIDAATGTEKRKVAIPDPASGAQEAKSAPGGQIVFSAFALDRIYGYDPKSNTFRFARTGSGPAVPLVSELGRGHGQLFSKRTSAFSVAVPHYKGGNLTLAQLPAGTSRRLALLTNRNLVGSSHGPGCSIFVADATPGSPALHRVTFAFAKKQGRLHACVTARAPDFVARMAVPFLGPVPQRPRAVEVSLTAASSDPRRIGASSGQSFHIGVTVRAKTSSGTTYAPSLTIVDTGPTTRLVRVTNIRAATRSMTLTVDGKAEVPLAVQIDTQAVSSRP